MTEAICQRTRHDAVSLARGGQEIYITYRNAGIRIRPENIAEESSVGHIARARNIGNLVHLTKFRRQAPVHANDLVIDDGTARQTVEGVAKLLPHLDRKAAAAFVIKAIDAVDPRTLMVAAQQEKVLWILNFVGKQQTHNFQ